MRLLVWMTAFALLHGFSWAQGVLVIPDEPPRHRTTPPERWMPIRIAEQSIRVRIDDGVAETNIEQVFVNESNRTLEAEYWFPVPDGATITRFTMTIGDKPIEAKLLPADEARRIYENIVRQQRDPALLEFAGRGLLRARVFPIPPRQERRISLRYAETLPRQNDMTRYTLPVRTVRAIHKPVGRIRIQIDLQTNSPLTQVYCPSHPNAWVQRDGDRRAHLNWQAENLMPERDLLLYYGTTTKPYDLRVFTHRTREDGYFLMLLTPNVKRVEDSMPKHLVFVFDRTGSMAGEKLQQAKEAFKYCLRNLRPNDRFNLIFFSEQPTKVFEGMMPGNRQNVEQAIREVDALTARGGTNIHDALLEAFRSLPIERTPALRAVVFLTDGLPTVGETDPERILRAVREQNERGVIRLFNFGVGYDVNVHLLDKLAEQNRGAPEYVKPNENIEAKVSSFYNRINTPVLTDLRLSVQGVETYDLYPRRIPDLFEGDQIVLTGRYKGSGQAAVTLEGMAQRERVNVRQAVSFPARVESMDFIPRMWAVRKVGYLLDEWRLHQNAEVKDEIIRLAQEHGIVTEFTAFLIDEDMIMAGGRELRRRAESYGFGRGGFGGNEKAADTGADAITQGERARTYQSAGGGAGGAPGKPGVQSQSTESLGYELESRYAEQAMARVRIVRARTFYQKGGEWFDSRYKPSAKTPVIEIAAFSDAYFELTRRHPELREYLALGDRVLIQTSQAAIRIGEQGKQRLTEAEWKQIGKS